MLFVLVLQGYYWSSATRVQCIASLATAAFLGCTRWPHLSSRAVLHRLLPPCCSLLLPPHSFSPPLISFLPVPPGGFLGVHLAYHHPELVKGLVLLNAAPAWNFWCSRPPASRQTWLHKLLPIDGTVPAPKASTGQPCAAPPCCLSSSTARPAAHNGQEQQQDCRQCSSTCACSSTTPSMLTRAACRRCRLPLAPLCLCCAACQGHHWQLVV